MDPLDTSLQAVGSLRAIYSLGLAAAVMRHTGGGKSKYPRGVRGYLLLERAWIWEIGRRIGAWTG